MPVPHPPLNHSKIRIACSREGVFFLVFIFGLGAVALYTAKNSLIILFCFLIYLFIAALIVGLRNVKNLTLSRRFNTELFADAESHISILAFNNSNYERYALHIYEDFDKDRTIGPVFLPTLKPTQTTQAVYDCIFPNRGPVYFRQIQVRSRFPFPFFEFRATYPLQEKCTVYPARAKSRNVIRFSTYTDTIAHKNFKKFSFIRELKYGRQTGRILWKLSARKNQIIEETQRNMPANGTVSVIQFIPKNLLSRELFETQISEITDCCLEACESKNTISLVVSQHSISSSQRRELLEFLANA